MRVGLIQLPIDYPARFLAVAGGATPPPTLFLSGGEKV
jgi:hypothetical protein